MNDSTQTHPIIAMDAVDSSQIAAIGHDAETNTLAVQFAPRKDGTPGSVYHYSNFTADDFSDFANADSIGSHFHRNIKRCPEKFPYVKVSG